MIRRTARGGLTAVPRKTAKDSGYHPFYWDSVPHENFPMKVRKFRPEGIALYLGLHGLPCEEAARLRREVIASIRRGNSADEIEERLGLSGREIRCIARENNLCRHLYENDCRRRDVLRDD